MVSTFLTKTRISGLTNLVTLAFPATDAIDLSIPLIAFVITKIYETFETNIAKGGSGYLNASHTVYWVNTIGNLTEYLVDQDMHRQYQLMDPSKT